MRCTMVNHTNFGSELLPEIGEVNSLPSKTIPGQTLSMRQLLERYVRGENVEVFAPQYTDDPDIPDGIENLTEIECIDLARDLGRTVEQMREDLERRKKKNPSTEPANGGRNDRSAGEVEVPTT